MKKIPLFLFVLISLTSCEEESSISYSEVNFTSEEFAVIEVNIPKIDGSSNVANKINSTIETFVANAIELNEEDNQAASIKDAILSFDNDYKTFTEELLETSQPWEAFVDGEVTYNSSEIISIAINTYLNTGGAHGNSVISFLNFNPSNGDRYRYEDVVDHLESLKSLVEKHFKKAIEEETDSTDTLRDYPFKLPETLGFSEDGIIIVYNQHELEDFSLKMLEFTIPYEEAKEFLTVY